MSTVYEQINLRVEEGGGKKSLLHEHTGQTWNVSLRIGNIREKSRVVSLSLYGNVVDKADVLCIHTPSLEIMKVWSQFCTHRTLPRPPRGTFGPGSGASRARRDSGLAVSAATWVRGSEKSASRRCHLISNSYLAHLTWIK